MRCGAVPVRIALAGTDYQAVAHIERYDQFFAFRSGYCTRAQYLHRKVDVVVGGVNVFDHFGVTAATLYYSIENECGNHLVVKLCIRL